MSASFPKVDLEKGALVYLNGHPVFIDEKGTHHFDIGKTMALLFQKGMQFQAQQAETIRKNAYEAGRRDQYSQDYAQIQSSFNSGRQFQAKENQKLMVQHQKETSKMVGQLQVGLHIMGQETVSLQKESKELRRQNKKLERIVGLNLSPRQSRRVVTKPSEQHQQQQCSSSSSSTTQHSLDITKLSPKERLECACKKSVEEPSFVIPNQVKKEIAETILFVINNFRKGYPRFKNLIQTLMAHPKNHCLHDVKSWDKRARALLVVLRSVVSKQAKEESYRLFIARLKDELQPAKFKALRKHLSCQLGELYPKVGECLDDGLIQQGAVVMAKEVKKYRASDNPMQILSNLSRLSQSPGEEVTSVKLALEIFQKNPKLLPDLEPIILGLIPRLEERHLQAAVSVCIRLNKIPALSQEGSREVSKFLAKAFISKKLPFLKLDLRIMKKWFAWKADNSCREALKTLITSDTSNPNVRSYVAFAFCQQIDGLFSQDQLRVLLLAFCKEWNGEKIALWELWKPLIEGASSEDRALFIRRFQKGIERSGRKKEHVLQLLEGFHAELRENSGAWKKNAYVFSKKIISLLTKIYKSGANKQFQVAVAPVLLKIWERFDFHWECWGKVLVTDDAHRFSREYFYLVEGSSEELKLRSLIMRFSSICIQAKLIHSVDEIKASMSVPVSDSLWNQIKLEAFKVLEPKFLNTSYRLFINRFTAHARCVVAKHLLSDWRNKELITLAQLTDLQKNIGYLQTGSEIQCKNDPIVKKYTDYYYAFLANASLRGTQEAWEHFRDKELIKNLPALTGKNGLNRDWLISIVERCIQSKNKLFLEEIVYKTGESLFNQSRIIDSSIFFNRYKQYLSKEQVKVIYSVLMKKKMMTRESLKALIELKNYST